MLTQDELLALSNHISNHAKVIYLLGLRPTANSVTATTTPLNYKSLLNIINGGKEQFTLGREINEFIEELIQVNLVELANTSTISESLNGHVVTLPKLLDASNKFYELHQHHFTMHIKWLPDEILYNELAKLVGIINIQYNMESLGEFIAYWMGRPTTQLSSYQWHQKFVQFVKMKRTVHTSPTTHKVGTQEVTLVPSVEIDDNAKKLVEKYAKKIAE